MDAEGYPDSMYGNQNYGAAGYSGYSGAGEAVLPSKSYQPARPNNFHTVSLGLLVLLPAMMFLLISLAMAMLYHQMAALCWCLTALFVSLSVLFMMARPVRDGPRYWFNLGCLCLCAVAAANGSSLWNVRRNFSTYWAYEGQREYTGVLPSDPALSHLDAGSITFSGDAHVDVSASVGLMGDQHRFCVAPIVGGQPLNRIQYWAAGTNCCGSGGGNFTCGSVGDQKAHAGLVYLDYGPRRDDLKEFRKAALEAGAAHGADPAEDALFVEWVVDTKQAQLWYWSSGMAFLGGSVVVYSAFSLVAGVSLHFGRRNAAPRGKLEFRSQ